MVVAELRISDVPGGAAGRRRVEVLWQDGAARRVAVAEVAGLPGGGEGERVRWYLEDYAEFPADPAPVIAREAEAQLAQAGAGLFRAVFADVDAMGIWERARDRLGQVRVEVEADPGEGPGIPWELLRDPGRDAPVALGAGAFVRTHLRAAGHPALPEPSGDRLRVLLVIARPGGRDDVPFRSVASRLVRGGAGRMEGLDLDVLRPATFARLSQVLEAAYAAGRPYHVVHFDGHGDWLDPASDGGGGAGGDGSEGPGGGAGVSPPMYGGLVAGPVRPGQHGYLLFEDPKSKENQQLVDGPALGRLLAGTGVPVLVLNACRSAYSEARSEPGDAPGDASVAREGDGVLTGDVHARIRAYGSLAAEVADAGVPGVVAMRYNVYVVTAAQFVADLYAHLLAGNSLGQSAAAARKALAADPVRQIGPVPVALQDWTVPIVYESAPLVLLRPPDRAAPLITLAPTETRADQDGAGAGGLPRPPDAGFFGRDETLLAAGPSLRHPAGRAAARVRRGGQVRHGGGVRPLVCRHRRPRPPRTPRVGAGSGAVVLLRAPPECRPGPRRRRGPLRQPAGGQRHRLGGGHRPRPAPRPGPAGAGAGTGAVDMGQRRTGHRVPGRHPQRLDPGRTRRPR